MCSNGTVHSSTYLSLTGTVRHSSTKRSFIYCLWWPLCRRFRPWREGGKEWRAVGGSGGREWREGGGREWREWREVGGSGGKEGRSGGRWEGVEGGSGGREWREGGREGERMQERGREGRGKEDAREGEEQNEGKDSPINPGTLIITQNVKRGVRLSVPNTWL